MRRELVDLLICPSCQASLRLNPLSYENGRQDEIAEGLLVCSRCTLAYPVTHSIPRLLPNAFRRANVFRRKFSRELSQIDFRESPSEETRRFEALHRLTARTFGYEWNTYRVTPPDEDKLTFFWLTGADPDLYNKLRLEDVFCVYPTAAEIEKIDGSQLVGKTVLDVGCGMGKYLAVVSEYAPIVVGLDLSDALVRARSVVKDRSNVHLVQGNILQPPMKTGFADFVYSVG